jgi:hypothetical protein
MKHPDQEEWIAYLYEECAPNEHAACSSHLKTCPTCAGQLDTLRATMKRMDDWQVPAQAKNRRPAWASLKWGMAAMLMIGFGFALARAGAPTPDLATLRSDLEPALRRQIASQCQANFAVLARQIQTQRAEDLRTMTATLQRIDQLDQQREVDYTNLRKELETVALNARNRFNITEQQLVQLASTAQPIQSTRP